MPRSIRFFNFNRWNNLSNTITSSGERTDHEAELTRTIALAESWRSSGLSGAYISADLGAAYRIGGVCLVRCNLTNSGTFRIRIGNTSDFSTNLYDSGFQEKRRYFSDTEIAMAQTSEFFPEGLPIPDMAKRIQRQIIVVMLPAEVTARYVRIDFSDSANPDGYIEVSYIYSGIVLEPDRDLLYGWKLQREDFVRDGQAACGQYWSASVYNKTMITLEMAPQRESDLLSHWLLAESLEGINCSLIVSLIDRTDSLLYTTTIYGKWAVVPVNTNSAFLTWNLPMVIEELVD